MDKLQVTQSDREAAAKLLGYRDWGDATDYRLTGRQDQQVAEAVHAFARHRIEAEQRIVEWLRGDVTIPDLQRATGFLADAIEYGAHREKEA